MQVNIDPEALTMGDLEDLETIVGNADGLIGRLTSRGMDSLTMKELNALVWICGRKDDPSLTLEDVRAAKLVDMDFKRPLNGAGAASKNGSRRSPVPTRGARQTHSER